MTTPSPDALREAIATLRAALGPAPRNGLPEDLFLFVSSLTPLVNVDLLIRDDAGRMLLGWRHDAFYGPGWHVPGSFIPTITPTTRWQRSISKRFRKPIRYSKILLCDRHMISEWTCPLCHRW